jgi:heavy metal sensor kinase
VALSLRARLTAWYSVLLVLTMAVFSAAVLWLHWRLLVNELDESILATSLTADNVVHEEMEERNTLKRAVAEMNEVVRSPELVVEVLDGSGAAIEPVERSMPVPGGLPAAGVVYGPHTLRDPNGRSWRVSVRARDTQQGRYFVLVGTPLDDIIAEWRALLRASLVGIPLALAFAAAGGWLLGRHGLRPLTTMAAEAQTITEKTAANRLTVPPAGEELEQLAQAFNRVLERLGSALSTQRQFMADASHELRTPVSIMRTAADVTLSQKDREDAEYREALAVVSQQSSRLARLVDDMLVLARADAGGYPMTVTEVDLSALVAQCVRELRGRAEEKKITMQTSLHALFVNGDETLLRRMVGNLIGNALTYTPAGGAITITLTSEGADALLRVADTGPGIPPGDRERVFERFVRLDPARAGEGAGLGLAIARWVAEVHAGRVWILSSGPTGTVFAARLPGGLLV